jgi:hypothetical protein
MMRVHPHSVTVETHSANDSWQKTSHEAPSHSTLNKPNQLNLFSSQEGWLAPAQESSPLNFESGLNVGNLKRGQATLPDLKIGWVASVL